MSADKYTPTPQEANAGGLGPVNSTVVLTTTLTGVWASVYADLFGASSLAGFKGWMALGWVLAIPALLYIAGHASKAAKGPIDKIRAGLRVAISNPGYGLLLLLMTGAAVLNVWGKARPETDARSLLLGLADQARRAEQNTAEAKVAALRAASAAQDASGKADLIRADTAAIRTNLEQPLSPQQALAKRGVAWNGEAFGEALLNSDLDTVQAFIDGGWNVLSGYEEGNALGHMAYRGFVTAPEQTRQILVLLGTKVNLAARIAQFRGFAPVNMATSAVLGCNIPMLRALKAAGVDVHAIQDHPVRAVEMLERGTDCPTRDEILALVRG